MDVIDNLAEIVQEKDRTNLYFLNNNDLDKKTIVADAVRAGF